MLTHEWHELERLSRRLADLEQRFVVAQRSKNVGLIEGLRRDLGTTKRSRDQLIQYISARLGAVAAQTAMGAARAPAPIPEERSPAALVGLAEGKADAAD